MKPRFNLTLDRVGVVLGLALTLAAGSLQAAPPGAYRMNLEFVDDHGAARALSDWSGRPVIIAMAYGACRAICSTTLRTLEQVQSAADLKGVPIEIVVVSIEPSQDTPQAWADYRQSRRLERANWTFLSGSKGATRALAGFLGIKFWSYGEHVMHDFKILRLNADGAIDATIDWNHRQIERLF
jgi:protein SCO1